MLSPAGFVRSYITTGEKKASSGAARLFILGIVSGFLVGCGACVSNTATFAIENPSVARIISGLLFPFNLFIITMLGAELFTGNNLITISVLAGRAKLTGLLRNWALVYLGNLTGGILLAAGVTASGQMDLGGGALAVHAMRVAINKCSLGFFKALLLGVGCNILVCMGVVCAGCASGVPGKAVGAYLPISFFVICGFEHCVANMFYIPAGLFACSVPAYAQAAAAAGLELSRLSWGGFFINNLLPVTIGNIIGGVSVALLLWYTQYVPELKAEKAAAVK